MMDMETIRLECLKLAVQVATGEALESSRKAPSTERVAEVAKEFYAFVIESPVGGADAGVSGSHPANTSTATSLFGKKLPVEKDPIFK